MLLATVVGGFMVRTLTLFGFASAVLSGLTQVRGHFHGPYNITAFYRACIEKGLLQRERIAPNTFRRVVKAHELLKPDAEVEGKRRLAFAKAHANELWQADTAASQGEVES